MKTILKIGGVAAALIAAPAYAGTADTTMPVTAEVLDACTVSATPMAFGTIPVLGSQDIDAQATVSLLCTVGASYDVAMDVGLNSSGGGQRYLGNSGGAADVIPYDIYTDSARSAVWGNTVGNTVGGVATTGIVDITAYGRIPVSATPVVAGSYEDTVTVTVTF
ncbi:spore coat U domain-containing protein [Croceicoccus sediminis]|uniref:Csu type fimbrial protein n=1 Tax=Croceicoccus sediminis TaxID=2571150 RepID=UPI0011841860|nr:spore coat U domain-containing protein [Croceicoccus sediminis]